MFFFKGRRLKTAFPGGASSAPPVSNLNLSQDQSMITKLIAFVGHKFCSLLKDDDYRGRLFVNSNGQSSTQKGVSSRFKRIDM